VLSAKKIQSSKERNKTELRLAAVVMGIIGLVKKFNCNLSSFFSLKFKNKEQIP
jgi:hypothetical protein